MKLLLLLALAVIPSEVAEVVDSSAAGFTVSFSVPVHAPPGDVYQNFVHQIGEWWNPDHTFSRNAHNLSIDDKAAGCFCEKLPDSGGVRHFDVINVTPGKQMVLSGAMGPLQAIAATGTMTIRFTAADSGTGTKIDVVYTVAGYTPGGINKFATPVDTVVHEQFDRLKNYIETGSPVIKK